MSEHPLENFSLKVTNFKAFGDDPTGFDSLLPINLIVGRNNSGKSALIDVLEYCISKTNSFSPFKHSRAGRHPEVTIGQPIPRDVLRGIFSENTSGGGVPGVNHWDYGSRFIGKWTHRSIKPNWFVELKDDNIFDQLSHSRNNYARSLANNMPWPFDSVALLRVAAERDVRPEARTEDRTLSPSGAGATNLIRAFIQSDDLPREEVERYLLDDLNIIYEGDAHFDEIVCRDNKAGLWEIFLREAEKGDVRLSESGSSLKSIILILSTLRLLAFVENVNWKKAVLALEEPENNLHPALLRRLLNFLSDARDRLGFTLLITTHSPIGIDWASPREDSQILHVQHVSGSSLIRTAIGWTGGREILDDLEFRASDILQANGIVWVEGPSDRVYVNHWIGKITLGKIKEGVHYTIMYYGGKVLSHFDGLTPDESKALVSLLKLNRNAALIMDSDRHLGRGRTKTGRKRKPRLHLNETKSRIKNELESVGALVWVTEGREVENYVSDRVLSLLAGVSVTADEYEDILDLPALTSFKGNKVSFAHAAVAEITETDIHGKGNLPEELAKLVERVKAWNGIR